MGMKEMEFHNNKYIKKIILPNRWPSFSASYSAKTGKMAEA